MPGRDVADDLLLFHILAVRLSEAAHSSDSVFMLLSKVFDALCTAWKVKIIISSTDGAPSIKGCNVGFVTQLANVVIGSKFYRVWGLAHQLNLVIKGRLQAISDTG